MKLNRDTLEVLRFLATLRHWPTTPFRAEGVMGFLGLGLEVQTAREQNGGQAWRAVRDVVRDQLKRHGERSLLPSEVTPPSGIDDAIRPLLDKRTKPAAAELIELCRPCGSALAAAARIVSATGMREQDEGRQHDARRADGARVWRA